MIKNILFHLGTGVLVRLGITTVARGVTTAVAAGGAMAGVGATLFITELEATENAAYLDQAGIPTICVGHTSDDAYPFKMGDVWSDEKCQEVLEHDMAEAFAAIDARVAVPLETHQRNALASFVFNVGTGAFKRSTLLRRLNAGEYDAVPYEMRRWNKVTIQGKRTVSPGLINRREREVSMWLGNG